jgi:hypothetical protein
MTEFDVRPKTEENELPEAFKIDPTEVTPTPAEVQEEQSETSTDPLTGTDLGPNSMPTSVVDPYNLRYKPNPAIVHQNYVPFPNHSGQTLSEDASLNPLRNAGLAPENLTDSDQPQTPEDALGQLSEEEIQAQRPHNEDYENGDNGTDLEHIPDPPVDPEVDPETENNNGTGDGADPDLDFLNDDNK